AHVDIGRGAVEEVRRERDVALARDALGDVADVRAHAADLHPEDHARVRTPALRPREVRLHLSAVHRNDDALGRDVHGPSWLAAQLARPGCDAPAPSAIARSAAATASLWSSRTSFASAPGPKTRAPSAAASAST